MVLEWLNLEFSVGKWSSDQEIKDLGLFSFWARTEKELSLVCPTSYMPKDVAYKEDGWVGFRVVGQMEFSMVGILAEISNCLAEKKISIFAVSTYDTDYIFIKQNNAKLAQDALEEKGWKFQS